MESAYIHGFMLKKIIICILAAIVSGCSESDPALYVELKYINNSRHSISLDFYIGEAVKYDRTSIEILLGSSESVTYGGWESNLPDLVLPQTAYVHYDENILIVHKSSDAHGEYNNLCHNENYLMEKLDKKAQKYRYSFVFTETDYEYAVSAGAGGENRN